MKIFRLAALGAALLYLSDATRRAKLRDRVLGLIGKTRESVHVDASSGEVNVSDDLEQRVRTAQADDVENLSEPSGTEAPTSTS